MLVKVTDSREREHKKRELLFIGKGYPDKLYLFLVYNQTEHDSILLGHMAIYSSWIVWKKIVYISKKDCFSFCLKCRKALHVWQSPMVPWGNSAVITNINQIQMDSYLSLISSSSW